MDYLLAVRIVFVRKIVNLLHVSCGAMTLRSGWVTWMTSRRHTKASTAISPQCSDDAYCRLDDFSELAASVYPALWTLARGFVGSAEDAEDVVQEAMITGFHKREVFQPGSSFLAWMGTIVRLTAMNHRRREQRRTHTSLVPEIEPVANTPYSNAVDPETGQLDAYQQSFDDNVTKALGTLSPDARCCLLLRTQHNMDYETICQIMGLAKGTAMSHVHRARQAMRDSLRPAINFSGSEA